MLMNKKGYFGVLVSGAALVFAAVMPASAMEVKVSGDPCTLTVYSSQAEDAVAQEMDASDFYVYGKMGDSQVSVKIGEAVGFVDITELTSKLPEVPVAAMTDGSAMTDVNTGAKGDAAKDIQQKLIDLGYLTGTADGQYGNGTAGAVKKFQEEHGLNPTGNANVETQLSIDLAAAGAPTVLETTYPTIVNPEQKFASIVDLTDVDLSRYAGAEWFFSYDAFEKFGMLDPHIVIGTFTDESSDINKISITCSLKAIVKENPETGRLDVLPCLVTESSGAYRPYLQSAILASGGQAEQVTGGESKGALDGVIMAETGYVPLTSEALALLQSGVLDSVRITGMNNSYDIANTASPDQIAWFGANA